MWCTDLAATPRSGLPAGYRLRTYQPGDQAAWVDIHRLADLYNPASLGLFEQQFEAAREELPRRQFYLHDPAGRPVGTATAWFGQPPGRSLVGRVHWVAIVPAEQGRGLAKPLLSAVCSRLLELGHRQAYLTTSTSRLPAINLYFAYGFLPELDSTTSRQAWGEFLARHSSLPGQLRQGLAEWLRARLR
jgi:GNAT superfamily N-acetyltransferase